MMDHPRNGIHGSCSLVSPDRNWITRSMENLLSGQSRILPQVVGTEATMGRHGHLAAVISGAR